MIQTIDPRLIEGRSEQRLARRACAWAVALTGPLVIAAFAQGPPSTESPSPDRTRLIRPTVSMVSPEGRSAADSWLFGSHGSGDSKIFRIDEFDGAAAFIGEVGRNGISDIAFLSNGRLYGSRQKARGTDLMLINPRTGIGEIVGDMFALGVNALVASPDGRLFAASNVGEFLQIDLETGLAELIGPLGMDLASVGDLAFDDNGVLFAALAVDPNFFEPVPTDLATIDPATGIATVIGPTGFDDIYGLAFHPGAVVGIGGVEIRGPTLFGVSGRPGSTSELIVIDRQTGVGQSLGPLSTPDNISGLADNFRLAPTTEDLDTVSFFDSDEGNQCVDAVDLWTYCQHKAPPLHGPGIDVDDTFAWDANLAANADQGKPVLAIAPGRAVSFYDEVPPGGGDSNGVLIEHCLIDDPCDCQTTPSDCWWSRYLHMDDVQVSEGQLVKTGSLLGLVSDVGSDGEGQLHFAVYFGENTRQEGQGLLTSVDAVLIPIPPMFADGFESGDTSAWSVTVP